MSDINDILRRPRPAMRLPSDCAGESLSDYLAARGYTHRRAKLPTKREIFDPAGVSLGLFDVAEGWALMADREGGQG